MHSEVESSYSYPSHLHVVEQSTNTDIIVATIIIAGGKAINVHLLYSTKPRTERFK